MSETQTDPKGLHIKKLSPEEKQERRKAQLREAQHRFRVSHGLVKPKLTDEEKQLKRKEKAKQRYLTKKMKKDKKPDQVPTSYTVDYQRTYHKKYYESNKEKLLTRAKTRYFKKLSTEPNPQTTD